MGLVRLFHMALNMRTESLIASCGNALNRAAGNSQNSCSLILSQHILATPIVITCNENAGSPNCI